jgi:peptide-methionine (S)-S-oxide reductase
LRYLSEYLVSQLSELIMSFFSAATRPKNAQLPTSDQALPGRDTAVTVSSRHFVSDASLVEPFPDNIAQAYFGLGCFWGAERKFWSLPGVYSTAVGYAAGFTPNPSYEEVCSGRTAHGEVVMVAFDPAIISYEQLLKVFWESHNPTQGMRQGNDQGSQYRSGIYPVNSQQTQLAAQSKADYEQQLLAQNYAAITTEIVDLDTFYYAEDYHQQYLAKNPNGYCGLSTAQESGRPLYSCRD